MLPGQQPCPAGPHFSGSKSSPSMSWEPLCAGNTHKRKVAGQTAALEAAGVALHSTPLTLHGFCSPRQGTQGHWLSVPASRGAVGLKSVSGSHLHTMNKSQHCCSFLSWPRGTPSPRKVAVCLRERHCCNPWVTWGLSHLSCSSPVPSSLAQD